MKKVVFAVTKQGRYENTKTTGVGYITDTDLITTCISKSGAATAAPQCLKAALVYAKHTPQCQFKF